MCVCVCVCVCVCACACACVYVYQELKTCNIRPHCFQYLTIVHPL